MSNIVIIESPYAATEKYTVEQNVEYARRCVADAIARGETPFASHLFYTQPGVLNDENPDERKRGIEMGYDFWSFAKKIAFYTDHGISRGMKLAIDRAFVLRDPIDIEMRSIANRDCDPLLQIPWPTYSATTNDWGRGYVTGAEAARSYFEAQLRPLVCAGHVKWLNKPDSDIVAIESSTGRS